MLMVLPFKWDIKPKPHLPIYKGSGAKFEVMVFDVSLVALIIQPSDLPVVFLSVRYGSSPAHTLFAAVLSSAITIIF